MEVKRSKGKVVERFESLKEVKEEIRKELIGRIDTVEKVEFGNPELFKEDEIKRVKVIVNGDYEKELYIPDEGLDFWNGVYLKKSNFENKVDSLQKKIRYYEANGSV